MQLTKNPTESQQQFIDRIERAYHTALDKRNNYEAKELYQQLILERKQLNNK